MRHPPADRAAGQPQRRTVPLQLLNSPGGARQPWRRRSHAANPRALMRREAGPGLPGSLWVLGSEGLHQGCAAGPQEPPLSGQRSR